jgi:hypothetical protein
VVFEFLDPAYLKSKLDMLDVSLSSLRSALMGADNRSLTDVYNIINSVYERLDVALSTRASEATLSALNAKIPSPLGIIANQDVIGTTTSVLAVVDMLTPARQPYTIQNIAVSTTEGSTSITAPGAKILVIKNRGDADVLVGINGPVPATNPLVVRARTVKVIPHRGVTQVNYKVASGSTTIDIEYYN